MRRMPNAVSEATTHARTFRSSSSQGLRVQRLQQGMQKPERSEVAQKKSQSSSRSGRKRVKVVNTERE